MSAKQTTVLEDGDMVLSAEEKGWVLDALLLGLACWGEVEKALQSQENYKAIRGVEPEGFDVRHPTGTSDIAATFATALRTLQ
jgi:hypothetical protein